MYPLQAVYLSDSFSERVIKVFSPEVICAEFLYVSQLIAAEKASLCLVLVFLGRDRYI